MTVYQLLVPQLLSAGVILVIALCFAWRASAGRVTLLLDRAERNRRLDRRLAQMDLAIAHPDVPASQFITEWAEQVALQVTLDLSDPEALQDISQATQNVGALVARVSELERASGGEGMILTNARAELGRVVLTLTPRETSGAAERVQKVADAVNAAFASEDRPPADLGPLPVGVATARAEVPMAA